MVFWIDANRRANHSSTCSGDPLGCVVAYAPLCPAAREVFDRESALPVLRSGGLDLQTLAKSFTDPGSVSELAITRSSTLAPNSLFPLKNP